MQGIVLDIKDITDSREVMESKEPPKIRWFIYFILIIIAAAIIFACCFNIDEYTKVSGEIKTLNASSSIMSSSNCKLKDILVSEGQSVRKGDVLFILDADYAKEQKGILERKLESYESDLSNTKLLKKSIEEIKIYLRTIHLILNTTTDMSNIKMVFCCLHKKLIILSLTAV